MQLIVGCGWPKACSISLLFDEADVQPPQDFKSINQCSTKGLLRLYTKIKWRAMFSSIVINLMLLSNWNHLFPDFFFVALWNHNITTTQLFSFYFLYIKIGLFFFKKNRCARVIRLFDKKTLMMKKMYVYLCMYVRFGHRSLMGWTKLTNLWFRRTLIKKG